MASAHDDWVLNVLGFSVAEGVGIDGEDAGDGLEARLDACEETIDLLGDAPEADGLGDELARIRDLLEAGSTREASGALDLLETRLAEISRTRRMDEVGAETQSASVDFTKLLLRWRQAKVDSVAQVRSFADQVKSDPDVLNDPRYDAVMDVVAEFDSFVPRFTEELEEALHALENEEDAEMREQRKEDALAVVQTFIEELDEAEELESLAEVAQSEFGVTLDGVSELRASLSAMRKGLA